MCLKLELRQVYLNYSSYRAKQNWGKYLAKYSKEELMSQIAHVYGRKTSKDCESVSHNNNLNYIRRRVFNEMWNM